MGLKPKTKPETKIFGYHKSKFEFTENSKKNEVFGSIFNNFHDIKYFYGLFDFLNQNKLIKLVLFWWFIELQGHKSLYDAKKTKNVSKFVKN